MVEFKKVRFKNFRSYGNQFTEVLLNKSKTTVITAPNGSGKSTILMAIEFGLFGKVTGNINKNDLVNTVNHKDMVVEIEFSLKGKEVLIRRGVKPAVFSIYINNELVNQNSSIREYQTYLEDEVIGFNISSFRQVVSISGSNYIPFFMMTANQRRTLVEELLNLTVFTKMHCIHLAEVARTREAIREIETEIAKQKASILSLKRGLDTVKSQEEGYRQKIVDNISTANSRIEDNRKEIANIQKQINELNDAFDLIRKKSDKAKELRNYRFAMEDKVKKLKTGIEFLSSSDHCPTCQQAIDDEFKVSNIEDRSSKVDKFEKNLVLLENTLSKVELEVSELEDVIVKIRDLENAVNVKNQSISDMLTYVSEQQTLLGEKSEDGESLRTEIRSMVEKFEETSNKRLAILEQKQYNDVVAAIIKDNGIKSRVIKQYIPKMNNEINRFLEILDLGITFSINENFEERILSRFKDEMSYSNFSAGERARIDIAILFTWRELAKSKNSLSCNLLFLDEIFDSVLDETGLDSFINLLAYHLENTNVFLISHRPEVVDKFESNLKIIKTSTFSKIE